MTMMTLHQKFLERVTSFQFFRQPSRMLAATTPRVAIVVAIFHRDPRRFYFQLSRLHELESELVRLLFQLNNCRTLQLLDARVDLITSGSEFVVGEVCEL